MFVRCRVFFFFLRSWMFVRCGFFWRSSMFDRCGVFFFFSRSSMFVKLFEIADVC